jgi:hypothetical protein
MGSGHRFSHGVATRAGGALFVAGLLAAAVAPTTVAAAANRAHAPAASAVHFTWEATPGNIVTDSTYINNSATNGKPHALLFVTAAYLASGGGVYDNSPIGVWYTSSDGGEWAIFNENRAAMAPGMLFNVLIVPAPSATAFVFTSSPSNILGSTAFINSAKTNGKKTIKLQVTQLWDPGGVGGVYNDNNIGVYYDPVSGSAFTNKWGVFNQPDAGIASGVSFNVLVGSFSHGKLALQKASASTREEDFTVINNGSLNGVGSVYLFSTPVYNPNGKGGVYDNDATGVWYDESLSRWTVFQEAVTPVPLNAAFNLLFYVETV